MADIKTIFNNAKNKLSQNKKNILIITSLIFVLIFLYVLYKSYNISKVQQNINALPIIKAENGEIKVKHEIKPVKVNNDEFYLPLSDVDIQKENKEDVKVVEQKETINIDEKLNEKIDDLIRDLGGSSESSEIIVDESIKEVEINKQDDKKVEKVEEKIDNNKITTEQKQNESELYKAQLVAVTNKQQAENFIHVITNKYHNILKNLKIFIVEADLKEKGVFYRVHVGFFKTKDDGKKFCDLYLKTSNKKLLDCIVIK